MAINDKQNMGAVLIGLEIVANLIGRCAIYETLYWERDQVIYSFRGRNS